MWLIAESAGAQNPSVQVPCWAMYQVASGCPLLSFLLESLLTGPVCSPQHYV